MAKSYFTTNDLIESIKRRAHIPENQNTFQEEDFIAFLNEEMDLGVVPSILSAHEEFFTTFVEVPIVANKSSYEIPERAIGNKLRNVEFKDSGGNIYEMTRILPEDRIYFQGTDFTNISKFYFQGNNVVIVPDVGSTPTGSLVFTYFLRPNELVSENEVAIINSIDTTTPGQVTFNVSSVPTKFTLSNSYDLLQTKPPHKTTTMDVVPLAINSTTKQITFDSDDVDATDFVVGDYIAFAGEAIIPQIPSDLHVVLAHRAALRCMEAQGDVEGLNAGNAKLAEMEFKTGNIIDNRAEGNPQKVVNYHSPLRYARFLRRRRLW